MEIRYKKMNDIVGWIVFAIASLVYILTAEKAGSFWDCGEFISSCYKLQLPHPPGAPTFTLIGRIFIILFGDNPHNAAHAINIMNAFASSFTILFLFWSITFFAKRIVLYYKNSTLNFSNILIIIFSGVIGALAFTFSDSFWYSAVEGEVYAMSSFLVALLFWLMLKWEARANDPNSDKWIILIFYILGLSIGIHLLNLLCIPSIIMIYYFKKYPVTKKGTIIAFFVGIFVLQFVQIFLIQYTIKASAWFDILFVNSFGLPFFSGFVSFFIILILIFVFLFRYAKKKQIYFLKLSTLCVAALMIGYSAYFTTLIRSNADPSIDMYNVDNPITLEGYLSREQYGETPLFFGPDYTDEVEREPDGDEYSKGNKEYEITGKKFKMNWGSAPSAHIFPRMFNGSNDRQELSTYKQYGGIEGDEPPTLGNNIRYFITYQCGWMYMRYFMWNFSGKQNDLQGFGNVRDGNAITGIPFIDNYFLGDQSKLPTSIGKDNGEHNTLFMLPLILGLLGIFFHYKQNKKDFLVLALLFFWTGFGIVFYLNQAGLTPRERDYIYVGSYYVFAFWIGLGLIPLVNFTKKYIPVKVASIAVFIICLILVPGIMAQQEWNDHDRSQKTLPLELAHNYLESCPPNALLMSYGDNDTYPLWYAQEVEGIRPDVRVVVNSLFSTDWYTNELRYKVNNSGPFDLIFTKEQFLGNKRQAIYFNENAGYDKNKFYPIDSLFKNYIANDELSVVQQNNGDALYSFPSKKFILSVNKENAVKAGVINANENTLQNLFIEYAAKRTYMTKNDIALYAILATNQWKRPICFTSLQELDELGLMKYTRKRGLVHVLVPMENADFDLENTYNLFMNKFIYSNDKNKNIYYDEENRRHLENMRLVAGQFASYLVERGLKDSAVKFLNYMDKNLDCTYFPYGLTCNRGNQHDYFSMLFLEACYKAGDSNLINKVSKSLKKDLDQQLKYYKSLGENQTDEAFTQKLQQAYQNKSSADLSKKQLDLVQDALTTVQILEQIKQMEINYKESLKVNKK